MTIRNERKVLRLALLAVAVAITLSAASCATATQGPLGSPPQGSHGVDYTPDFSYGRGAGGGHG